MKLMALAAAAAVVALGCGGPAAARDLPAGGLTRQEVIDWLTSHGHAARIKYDEIGKDYAVTTNVDGVNWDIWFYHCSTPKAGRCQSIQYAAGWTERAGMDMAKINGWNRDHRYVRGYITSSNGVFGEYDVEVSPGGSWEQLDDSLAIWLIRLKEFQTFIGG
ncbi:MAG: YbjN protein [Phenylobacterium sp.]|nr:YbjN protein [Phenylobacterium sp.]